MIKCTLIFYGDRQDQYGMPIPFNNYLIVASEWEQIGSGIATVVPLTRDAPSPSRRHFIAEAGGPEAAVKIAQRELEALPKNKGLKKRMDCS